MRKAYRTVSPLNLAASQGDTCATIQSECCILIPDKSFNATHLNHMKNQISALRDPLPSLDIKKKNKLVWCGRLMAKVFTFNSTNVIIYNIFILLVLQDYYFLYY